MDGRPILLVEDDDAIRQAMAMLLMGEGYPVQTATNGAEGLRAIEGMPPSLVVLDMNMPVLDGRGFAAQAKARGFAQPILVITATRDNAARAATDIGAAGYLGKVSAHRFPRGGRDSARGVSRWQYSALSKLVRGVDRSGGSQPDEGSWRAELKQPGGCCRHGRPNRPGPKQSAVEIAPPRTPRVPADSKTYPPQRTRIAARSNSRG